MSKPWTADPPPGTPYHRMARTGAHRWWRPLVGSVTVLVLGMGLMVGFLLVGEIVAWAVTGEGLDLSGEGDALFGNDTADVAANLAVIALFLPVTLFVAWGVQRRRPGTLSSVAGRLRWKWMLVCSGLAIGYCIAAFAAMLVTDQFVVTESTGGDEEWVGWGRFLLPALLILLLVPFQAAAEEYLIRGWILQAVGSWTLEDARNKVGRALSVVFRTPWPGILVGSLVFMALHEYTGWGAVDIFAFAVITAWMTVRTGGLEAAIALHVFNNLLAFLFAAALGQLDIEQGALPWEVAMVDIALMALFAAAAIRLARRMRVQTVTAGPAEDDTPATTAGSSPAQLP
ncbi:CPBP family intramembrane metalloprotease [Actinomadura sp. GC306]|nr:CPBP family intramembrane metalloprotease [Actinomadura sp. GC306]